MGALLRKRVILTGREFLSACSMNWDRPGRCFNARRGSESGY
jgi:hypothetical protein